MLVHRSLNVSDAITSLTPRAVSLRSEETPFGSAGSTDSTSPAGSAVIDRLPLLESTPTRSVVRDIR